MAWELRENVGQLRGVLETNSRSSDARKSRGKQNTPDENPSNLPPHLAALLQPTPSGTAKLLAAWDGLSVESQMRILIALDKAEFPGYLQTKIRTTALDSANAYVRYLAARAFHFSRDEDDARDAIRRRIEADPNPLVRYCLLEDSLSQILCGELGELGDPEAFFNLPHEARLAKVRCLRGWGVQIAELISYAVDHHLVVAHDLVSESVDGVLYDSHGERINRHSKEGKVSEQELYELLADYVNTPWFHKLYVTEYDGEAIEAAFADGRDIAALWELVPKLPKSISGVLIMHLPPAAGVSPGIPEQALKEMTPNQLMLLLYRFGWEKTRRELFPQITERLWSDRVRRMITRDPFGVEYKVFAALLTKPKQEKTEMLDRLTRWTNDLSLVLYAAIQDMLVATDGPQKVAESAYEALKKKLTQLKSWQQVELRELRIYLLAKEAVPWTASVKGRPLPGELVFLAKSIVEGDTWATFLAFSEAWAKEFGSRLLVKYLPHTYTASVEGKDPIVLTTDGQLVH